MSAQHVSSCVVCGAVTEAFLCGDGRSGSGCLGQLIRRLGECAWLSRQLDTTLSRQDKVTAAPVGFVSGTSTRPLPLNLGASDSGLNLRDILCSWVRDLWETNSPGGSLDVQPTIVSASRWLMRHPTWIALHPAADEMFDEIMEAIRAAHRSIDIPKDNRRFLGKCGFEMNGEACPEELFASPRSTEVTCQTCGSWWSVEERSTWLLGVVEDEVATAPALSGLLCQLGVEVGEKDIQDMAKKGLITAVTVDSGKRRSYRVGDVLSVFLSAESIAS